MTNGTGALIKNLENKQSVLLKYLDRTFVSVTTEEEQCDVENLRIAAKGAIKEAVVLRMSITVPMDEVKKQVFALFAPYINRLQLGVASFDKALTVYHAQVVARQEEERMLRLAEEAARMEELQAEAAETGEIVEPQPMTDLAPPPSKTHRTDLGSVTYIDKIDVAVIYPNLVPRDLCEPSLRKIRARAESGVTAIPGVVITKKYITSGRPSYTGKER